MNIIIKENQLQILIEQVKVDKVEMLADQIWNATSGVGTDEEKVYDALKQITNLQFFVQVSTKLISKYNESFYDIVNSAMEFTDSEKNEIVKILNTNRIPHKVNEDGDVQYVNTKSQSNLTNNSGLKDVSELTNSDTLITFLKCEEGTKCEPNLESYLKKGDKWTIGWGHTGENVKPNMIINQSKAEQLLQNDTKKASDCVKRIFAEWKKNNINRTITQSMFDTLTSLAFNAGCGSLRGTNSSEDVIDYVKNGKFADAANKILTFKSNKPGFSGLKIRREKEKEMFCREGGCKS